MKPFSDIDNSPLLKVLAVSFAYPPIALPRSTQVARLLRHLKTSTVLVCGDEEKVKKDFTIEAGAEDELEACIRVPFVLSSWQKFINRVSYHFHQSTWKQKNMAPDEYSLWKSAALNTVETFMKEKSYMPEVLVTFGQPFTCHLIGLELKHRYNLPWLAHFSDPWVDNPFSRYDEHAKQINLPLEKQVIEKADLLVFTSSETIDLVFEKYSDKLRLKTRVVPHCFDTTFVPERGIVRRAKLIVRYLGDFYGPRTPAPILRTLRLMLEKNIDDFNDVCFEFIGTNYTSIDPLSDSENLPEGLVIVRPSVDYQESLQLMADSDGLLVIDAPADVSVFLPSKLIDYTGAGKPILGLTPPGPAMTLIQQLNGFVADPIDSEAMINSMIDFLKLLRYRQMSQDFSPWGSPEVRLKYEATHVAGLFSEMLYELQLEYQEDY